MAYDQISRGDAENAERSIINPRIPIGSVSTRIGVSPPSTENPVVYYGGCGPAALARL